MTRRGDFDEPCFSEAFNYRKHLRHHGNHENKLSRGGGGESGNKRGHRCGRNSWELCGTSSLSRIDSRDAGAVRRRDARRKSCAFKAPQFPGIHLPYTRVYVGVRVEESLFQLAGNCSQRNHPRIFHSLPCFRANGVFTFTRRREIWMMLACRALCTFVGLIGWL